MHPLLESERAKQVQQLDGMATTLEIRRSIPEKDKIRFGYRGCLWKN